MMNVGFVFNQSSLIGGGEISGIEYIASLRGSEVKPVAIVPGEGEISARIERLGIAVVMTSFPHVTPVSLLSWNKRVRSLAATFLRHDLHIVHVNGARAMLYAGPAARKAGIPCVWHNRVLHRDALLDRIRGRYAAAVIANSRAVAATLGTLGIRNVSVIYNGFDFESLHNTAPADLHREYQIAPHLPIILAAGRLCAWKGFDDLLQACGMLSAQQVPYFCLIAGKAMPGEKAYAQSLLEKKESLRLSNVHFTGWRNDVAAFMKAATVLAVPSHGEPFGRVVVEAWACGIPVVATNAGGPGEIIGHGENGLLVPQKDPRALAAALTGLLGDPVRRQTLAANGLHRATNFSMERHRDAVLTIYRSLSGRTRRQEPANA